MVEFRLCPQTFWLNVILWISRLFQLVRSCSRFFPFQARSYVMNVNTAEIKKQKYAPALAIWADPNLIVTAVRSAHTSRYVHATYIEGTHTHILMVIWEVFLLIVNVCVGVWVCVCVLDIEAKAYIYTIEAPVFSIVSLLLLYLDLLLAPRTAACNTSTFLSQVSSFSLISFGVADFWFRPTFVFCQPPANCLFVCVKFLFFFSNTIQFFSRQQFYQSVLFANFLLRLQIPQVNKNSAEIWRWDVQKPVSTPISAEGKKIKSANLTLNWLLAS